MIFENKILDIYKKQILCRFDDLGMVFYYSYKDFKGLCTEPYSFTGNVGQKLCGAFYYYENMSYNKIVIFEHGMGGGHRSYMKEIEILAKNGYTVLAYDHTGCMESEGENIRGCAQSICDLDYCIESLRTNDKFANTDISVIGHSWGGLSALNIGAVRNDISHIVSFSAPISVKAMVSQFFSGIIKFYVPAIMAFETAQNQNYANISAIDALNSSSAKFLIFHSQDDDTVKKSLHFDVLKNSVKDIENTEFVLINGKNHNPNYTYDAVKYKDIFFKDLTKKLKKKYFTTAQRKTEFKNSYNFDRMTKQDMDIWNKVFAFLEK